MTLPATSTTLKVTARETHTEQTRQTVVRTQGQEQLAAARQQQNTRILEASLEVSLRSGQDSQALLFRSAIEKINEHLATDFGPDAIQNAMGQDNSAEATANRIVSLATGFFDKYLEQHPGKDLETALNDFMGLIRGGFEQGFQEASEILKGLNVLEGDILAGIQKTYELVTKGFDDFVAARLNSQNNGGETPPAEDAPSVTA